VLRRRTHFALLRALGLPVRSLQALVLVEAGMVGTLGTASGLCFGVICAQLAVAHLGADLGAGFFSGVVARLRIDPLGLVAIAGCGLGASILGGLVPAKEAGRTAPAAALRSGSEQAQSGRQRLLPAAALLALGGVLALLPAVDGLPLFGYAAVGCLLLAALLLMPAYARAALAHLPLPGFAALRLALQQLRGAPRYASMSLAPILAAMSLTVAMLIMIVSFRQSLDTWLQIVLPADLYARAGSAYSTWLDAAMQERLQAAAAVQRIAFSRYDSVRLDPQRSPVTLIARDLDAQRPEAVQWVTPPLPPKTGTTPVWVSEAAQALFGLEVGSRLRIPVGGTPIEVTVSGVWRDYVRQNGAILLPRKAYLAAGGDSRANEAWIWLRPGSDPERAAPELRQSLRLGPELELREPRLLRELSLAAFDRTFAVTYALQLIAVLIGLFGISVGASAEAIARRRELGMLNHLGMARGQISLSLACEGGLVGGLGALAGLVAGTLMSLVLVHVINKQSFHWTMELHIPWPALVLLTVALAACATATAALSVRRALGSDIVQAVREDW
jgi:putative ABC transport system permease protein